MYYYDNPKGMLPTWLINWAAKVGIQWNPSKTDTTRTQDFVLFSEVSLAQGLIVDHAPLPVVANSNAARLRAMKPTSSIRTLLNFSFRQKSRTHPGFPDK